MSISPQNYGQISLCWCSSIGVAFGHNKLWLPLSVNSLFVTSLLVWSIATTNFDDPRLHIVSLWPLKFYAIEPHLNTMVTFGRESKLWVTFGHNIVAGPRAVPIKSTGRVRLPHIYNVDLCISKSYAKLVANIISLIGVVMRTVTYNTEKVYIYYHAETIPVIYK